MQIGTAAPTQEELAAAKHHFIHHKSIDEYYSVGDFEKEALNKLEQLFKKNSVVVLVGGSGLYIDAVTKGLNTFPKIDASIREQLNLTLKTEGIAALQAQLKKVDYESYTKIALKNPQRLIRALEVSLGADKPYSYYVNKEKKPRNFTTITIGLQAERSVLYSRINQRVDQMLQDGLVEEVKSLLNKQNLNALNTVGYKELFAYFNGDSNLEFAISEIKKNSRRFAKRQLTWFAKNKTTLWFDYKTGFSVIANAINGQLKKPTF